MLGVIMLSVAYNTLMLSVVMLNVVAANKRASLVTFNSDSQQLWCLSPSPLFSS
jgi:hypothetical protein